MLARERARVPGASEPMSAAVRASASATTRSSPPIILAGGRSSRMGRPKPWLDLGGRSLLARVVERSRTWADEIVIVAAGPISTLPRPRRRPSGSSATTIPARVHCRRWRSVSPASPPRGRSRSDAMRRSSSGDVLARLARERGDVDAVMPLWDGRPQPLVALYRRTLGADVAATGRRGRAAPARHRRPAPRPRSRRRRRSGRSTPRAKAFAASTRPRSTPPPSPHGAMTLDRT